MIIHGRDYRQPKQFLPGTRRARTPSDTLRDFGRHMPELGITRLANLTGLDCIGIPVVQAVRPNSRSLSVSQGKGADLESAKVSAMMEATELWHAERIDAPLRIDSYDSLRRSEAVVDIYKLRVLDGGDVRGGVQQPWIRGWDLLQQRPVWVPYGFLNMNTVGLLRSVLTYSCTSNGLASGNHLLEAIEHALCEIIERDTHALYWAKSLEAQLKTRIDLTTVSDPGLRGLFDLCTAAAMEVAAYEMKSDIGIPTYCVGLLDRADHTQWRRLGTQWGAGTHLSPTIAMSRAVTEAAQSRLTVIAGSRDDNSPDAYSSSQNLERINSSRDTAFAAPPGRVFPAKGPLQETDTFEGDLELMLNALQRVGVDSVVVVDLTKEHLGIPVVKVLAPDLEPPPFLPGYSEGARAQRARQLDSLEASA